MSSELDNPHSLDDEPALRAIVEAVEAEIGERFFPSLVKHLATALGCAYAIVTELFREERKFRTRAVWGRGSALGNLELPLKGTPCELVLKGETASHPDNLQRLFPDDEVLGEWGVVSYSGVPLLNSTGICVGHLAIFDDKPMVDGPRGVAIMRIFAARARAEIERLEAEAAVKRSEERLARVLDSAMDAIITFDGSMRIELFNGAAETVFRCPRTDVVGGSLDRFLTNGFRDALKNSLDEFDRATGARPYIWAPGGLLGVRRDGQQFPVDATISCAEAGGRKLYTLILRDTDERRRAEQKLRDLGLQNEYLQEEIKAAHNFEEIVGQSPALSAALDQVNLVAATDSTVLILGETGTGKELIARAIHSHSPRKDRPLIKVNCAALPTGLVESELFGHEKGAFTGATERRTGRFELADGGSIFLDEIAEMSADVQAKLLRVLQEHEVERVGGHATVKVDVRVIAATNRNLQEAVAHGTFRQDLYYRLNVFPLRLPPLRQRAEDIPQLVYYFVDRYAMKIGRKISHVSDDTMRRLVEYSWPGNVRELENVIERAVIVSAGPELQIVAESLPLPLVTSSVSAGESAPSSSESAAATGENAGTTPLTLDEIERKHIVALLERTRGRIDGPNGAARFLNLNPSTLRSRMKKFGISRKINDA